MPLVVESVDLHDHAVAAVIKAFPALNPRLVVVENLFRGVDEPAVGVRLEAESSQGLDGLPMRVERHRLGIAEAVDVDVEGTFSSGPRVQLADRPRRRVARVRVRRQPLRDPPFVESLELGLRKDDLAANLEPSRRSVRNPQRNAPNRPHVGRHILTDHAVPPRRPAREPTALVRERHRQPVELELADHVELPLFQ